MNDKEYYDKLFTETAERFYGVALSVIVGILICLLLGSCRTIEYVPVETVKVDTLYQSKVERDSIHVHDSVFVNRYVKGDTVYVEKTKWRNQFIEKYKTDTIHNTKIVSMDVPVLVEKPLGWFNQLCVDYGKVMIGVMIAAIVVAVVAIRKKKNLGS